MAQWVESENWPAGFDHPDDDDGVFVEPVWWAWAVWFLVRAGIVLAAIAVGVQAYRWAR